MEFINGGDMFYHLRKSKKFDNARTQFYAAEILLAMEYMHSVGIIYRDLKPENVLIDYQGHIKIIDFGLSKLKS
jgi:serine/threonine protein kinase